MRDYAKVSPKFWMGQTGKALRKQGLEAQLVGLYLLTSPHSTMLGLYTIPILYIAHETGLGIEGASKGLKGCIEAGFCMYDEGTEMVWVIEMAHFQIAESLSVNDKQCLGVQRAYGDLIENPFLSMFYDKYEADFHLTKRRVPKCPLQAPSMPLVSKEKEKEKEQEQKKGEGNDVALKDDRATKEEEIATIFAYWQKTMKSPRSAFDADRRKLIEKALKNYTPREVCEAIRGCAMTPHNMGINEQKTKYNGLNVILKNADNIDRFIRTAHAKPNGKVAGEQQTEAEKLADIQRELEKLDGHAPMFGDDDNTIDMENPNA